MTWNWQQPLWPNFSWRSDLLQQAEDRFLVECGVVLGTARHLDADTHEQLTVRLMTDEALTSSAIEGETLERASVQSSIRRELGLQAPAVAASPAEEGMAKLMVAVARTFAAPLEHETLFGWHKLVIGGARYVREIGFYRTHAEPMQIVSGKFHEPTVHFEAPPSARVPAEMEGFIEWFNRTGPEGTGTLPSLTRAGIAHLYFESIHPFEDGNGRLGRAVTEKALAQGFGQPTLTALAATILRRRRAYYEMLEASNKVLRIDAWLRWFAGIVLEAQRRAHAQVEFLLDKARLLDQLREVLNARQEKVLLRVLAAGPDGFEGGLSAGNYQRIARTSPATARRDLAALVEYGALHRTGERRYARYHPAIPLRRVGPIFIDEMGNVTELSPIDAGED